MSKKHLKNKKTFFGRPVWRNSIKTIRVEPLRYYSPENLEQVMEAVQEGIDKGLTVRAVGSGHSFSPAPKAEGILIETDHLEKIEPYKFTSEEGFFEVEGGIKLEHLNESLDKLGYCIPTMGGIDHQSVAGAISTGTHGSSMEFGAMANMVHSIVLVTQDLEDHNKAKVYRIERSEGSHLTKDATYDGPELLLDDDFFNTALVCFGSMGIIYSYVLKVEKMYKLLERKEVCHWAKAKEGLRDGSLLENHRSIFVQINPYKYKDTNLALIVYHDLYSKDDTSEAVQQVKHKLWDRIKRMTRSFQFELASIVPYFLWFVIWRINKWPGYIPKFIHNAVKSQKDDEYINKGYKVMYQGLDYIKERAYDCEIAIPLDKEGKYLEKIELLMAYLEELHKEYKIHITSPIGLRFVKASEIFLTPENRQDVCYIDTPILKHIYGRNTLISQLLVFLVAQGGRPHWGKINHAIDETFTRNSYQDFDRFLTVVKKFNPIGVFSNSFTKRVIGY
ncbi:FAD-binding protein [Fulvivirga sp. RKSG066]|uniref:D-arabinono-1,4-lactone oxidase n=1 Tax=Fulvivirga aurantia TaxID=2529383 RepID=UPI0012BC0F5A|nr:D-arabinono-1,4-lactone oxidase [Fulvivirga aurantia]MTI20524.1 FAD-binding protein [Fulvivirga aurantia]